MNSRHLAMGINLLKHTRLNKAFFKYLKNLWTWHRLNKEQTTIEPYPTGLMLELGNVCNLRCIICPREYQYGKQMDIGFMPIEKAKSIIDETYPYLTSIGLTGLGETLLYPNLLEILQYIKAKKPSIQTTISTNANFVGFVEKMLPLLPFLDSIQFSVDGIGKVYETVRPNTDFSVIKANIKEIVSKSKHNEFMVNTVITRENYHNLVQVIEFANEVGIKYVNFNRINLASIPEQREQYTDFFYGNEYAEVVKTLDEYKKKNAGVSFSGYLSGQKSQFRDCGFVWNHHYITWDGYFVPCCAKPFPKEMNFGNVFENGVFNTINSKKAQAFRRMWQQNEAPEFCKYCNNINL